MKIEDKRKEVTCEFEALGIGDTFIFGDEIFMVTSDEMLNAVSLNDGFLAVFNPKDAVIPIKAKVVVE